MKNLFTYGCILAILFLTLSCSKDDQDPYVQQEEESFVVSDQEAIAVGIPATEVMRFNHPQNFRTRLKGEFEVPPVETKALGIALFRYSADSSRIYFILGVNHIQNVTAAHIHIAPPGESGSIVVPLFTGPIREGNFVGVLNKGYFTDEDLTGPLAGMTLQDLVKEMEMGNAYVNVHTSQHPSGEIRGQIR